MGKWEFLERRAFIGRKAGETNRAGYVFSRGGVGFALPL